MSQEPPAFQEASRCDVCKCSFSTFRRRHHCRCCGRTLCAEHSSNQMALPQYGINPPVRVCSDCFNDASRSGKEDSSALLNGVAIVADSVSRLDINTVSDSKVKPMAEQSPALGISECKCGMPLCICEAPTPSEDAASSKNKPTLTSSGESNPKTKKTDTMVRSRGSTSISKQNSVFNQMSNSGLGNLQIDYEVNGEGIREAIKKGDTAAVKKLLSQGVDANYWDKQGLSLLHVAAVFNQTDIAFALMEAGAMLECKNLQGETPLDCAPATLQYKMKKKIEEAGQLNHIV